MKSHPSNIIVWVVAGVMLVIAFYLLGAFLLQAKNQSLVNHQDLETN